MTSALVCLFPLLLIPLTRDAPHREHLIIPEATWNAIDHHLGLHGRPLGYTQEQMANYGRDLYVLRPVLRQFEDVRGTLRYSGMATDTLLNNAIYEDEFIRHAFSLFLDEGVGRRIRIPGLDASGTSGELPDTYDPAQETGGWCAPWLEDLGTTEALRMALSRLNAQGVPDTIFGLAEPEQRLITRLLVATIEAAPWVDNALDAPSAQRALAASHDYYGMANGYTVAIAPRVDVPGSGPLPRALLDIVGTIDLGYLGHAGVLTAKRVRLAVAEYRRTPQQPVLLNESVRFTTSLGEVVIQGSGDDTLRWHKTPAPLLVLDFGGNDRYIGAYATSDGLRGRPVSILIDLGGDDVYMPGPSDPWLPKDANNPESHDRHVPTLASGIFGIGMLWDLGAGDDTYEAYEASMGVGMHGVGLLIDDGGNDTYTVQGHWGQGVGHVGLGALIDHSGDDTYTAGPYSQAHGSTRGAGVLVDRSGNDRYTIPDDAAPSELYLGRTVAMGQGCGYGRRADLGDSRSMAGGFGVLIDGAGDDHYSAMAWSQGAGYWWGVGILEDRGGNDTYRNGKYSLGAAAHFAVGVHVNLEGNDTYNANPQKMINPFTGQEQWILENQYAGHARDGSIGLFVDGGGDDTYVLRANCGGSADLNSIGFFWDRAGNDTYIGLDINSNPANPNWERPPLGTTTRYPNPFRNFRDDLTSYGVFIDSAGDDTYEGLNQPINNGKRHIDTNGSGKGVAIDFDQGDPQARFWQRHENGPWAFNIIQDDDTGDRIASIEYHGAQLWQTRGLWFQWGFEDNTGKRRGLADDITGTGVPMAVLYHNHGDSKGQSTTHLIFDLNALLSPSPNASIQELGLGRFEDRDGDGAFEFYEREPIRTDRRTLHFIFWTRWPEICYTYMPANSIRSGEFKINPQRMRRPPLPREELNAAIRRFNQLDAGRERHFLDFCDAVEMYLELIATGHHENAQYFWKAVRPCLEEFGDFDQITAEIQTIIAQGPYASLLLIPDKPSR